MPTDGLLFAGTTTAPARDFVAEQFGGFERIVLPCVGRWAVATAVAARHGAKRIEASDLCLFSSVIGYMADPRHSLEELGVVIPERYEPLVAAVKDEADWAAGVLIAIKLATLVPSTSTPAKSGASSRPPRGVPRESGRRPAGPDRTAARRALRRRRCPRTSPPR